MSKIVKWGFGLAPFKPETLKKYTGRDSNVLKLKKHLTAFPEIQHLFCSEIRFQHIRGTTKI